jgi:hypothetical protein
VKNHQKQIILLLVGLVYHLQWPRYGHFRSRGILGIFRKKKKKKSSKIDHFRGGSEGLSLAVTEIRSLLVWGNLRDFS